MDGKILLAAIGSKAEWYATDFNCPAQPAQNPHHRLTRGC